MSPRVSLILTSHNGEKFLPECLSSLSRSQYPHGDLEFIFIDNHSSDRSAELLKTFQREHPERRIKILENEKNLGFCGGYNRGLQEAMKGTASFFILINQDTMAEKSWIEELVHVAEIKKDAAIIQARLMLWNEKDAINSIGNEFHFLGFGYTRGYGQKFCAEKFPQAFDSIPYASGCAFLVRREALEKIGLLDEDIFAYHEDTDWSLHSRAAGYDVLVAYRAIVWHKYEFSRSIKKYYYMERNRFLLLLWYYKIPTLLLIFPAWLMMEAGLWFFALKNHWCKEKLRVYAYFFSIVNWKKILQKRSAIQKQRRISDRKLLAYATGKIEFQEVKNILLKKFANPFFEWYWNAVKKILWW